MSASIVRDPIQRAEATVKALNIFVDLLNNSKPEKKVSANDTGHLFGFFLDGLDETVREIKQGPKKPSLSIIRERLNGD
jgi:hypothetical protein